MSKKKCEDLVVWGREDGLVRLAARCGECGGEGRFIDSSGEGHNCEACEGLGWFGIEPERPVAAHAGSVAKVAMLSVRYATGAPLWNPKDGLDGEAGIPAIPAATSARHEVRVLSPVMPS